MSVGSIPVPVDNEPNKALAAAALALVNLIREYAVTGNLNWEGEGLNALIGALLTAAVFYISNRGVKPAAPLSRP